MKKVLSMLLALAMVVMMVAGCGNGSSGADNAGDLDGGNAAAGGVNADQIKVGVIYIGDENEGYTVAHMEGIQAMKAALNLSDDQVIEKTLVPEDESAYDASVDLAEQGCNIIFGNSFNFETYMMQAAAEYPNIQFCHATGYQAATSGLGNMHNYFTAIYQARYVAGVVAGLKLQTMIDNGTIAPDKAKIGYVGAFPYAEVISGYTSFFLGARSVCQSATMEVRYINEWADMSLEKECAEALMADGCVLISQHSDTTGAATACEAAGVPIVGYNLSMIAAAPKQALTSAANNWAPYYIYAVQSVIDGQKIATDWCKGYDDGAVNITALNPEAIAAGTKEKADQVETDIKSGSLHVFDTSTFTVGGKPLTTFTDAAGNELVSDGYFHESEFSSAPSFNLVIDGITSIDK